jgi:hypothetical protein
MWHIAWLLLAAAALFGCAPTSKRPPLESESGMPVDYPLAAYQRALLRGKDVYRLDTEGSEIVIRVYRGGRLARMGHNHTVASRAIRGHVLLAEPFTESRVDLYLPVALLIVDDPSDRAAAGEGFDSEPSAKAIEGTRGNLLGDRVLDAGRYPFVQIVSQGVDGQADAPVLNLGFSIRGNMVTRSVRPDVSISKQQIVVSGQLSLNQTAFGIEPYSVLGGALKVEDEMQVHYELVAKRIVP